jgi:hypothetical protein
VEVDEVGIPVNLSGEEQDKFLAKWLEAEEKRTSDDWEKFIYGE